MLFVNVPIGIAVAVIARLVLVPGVGAGAGARTGVGAGADGGGRLDLPGTITGTAGIVALVYGLSNAATSPDGTSHWGDAKVVAALSASVVLLAAFMAIESRSSRPAAAARDCCATGTGSGRT